MELRHLRYFVAVAETENVSRAAVKLHVSQPGLSTQIRDLEAEIGILLFERTAKSLSLTEAGHVFLDEARDLLRRADEAVKKAQAIALTAVVPELHVGYSPTPTARILPDTLRAFHSAMPEARVKLHDLTNQEIIAGLRDGRLQIAFILRPQKVGALRDLRTEDLSREAVRLAVPSGHPFARRKVISLEEAAREPFVVYSRREYPDYRDWFESIFAGIAQKPRVVEEHDGASSLLPAIEAGIGVTLGGFPAGMSGSRFKLLRLQPEPAAVVLCIAAPRGSLSSQVAQFWECAVQAASEK
jgi:LysR family transcriptional regulator, benzoate and cis,cis-muconate-responsive activator of ben and cat genes